MDSCWFFFCSFFLLAKERKKGETMLSADPSCGTGIGISDMVDALLSMFDPASPGPFPASTSYTDLEKWGADWTLFRRNACAMQTTLLPGVAAHRDCFYGQDVGTLFTPSTAFVEEHDSGIQLDPKKHAIVLLDGSSGAVTRFKPNDLPEHEADLNIALRTVLLAVETVITSAFVELGMGTMRIVQHCRPLLVVLNSRTHYSLLSTVDGCNWYHHDSMPGLHAMYATHWLSCVGYLFDRYAPQLNRPDFVLRGKPPLPSPAHVWRQRDGISCHLYSILTALYFTGTHFATWPYLPPDSTEVEAAIQRLRNLGIRLYNATTVAPEPEPTGFARLLHRYSPYI